MATPWEQFVQANKDNLSVLDRYPDFKPFWMGDYEDEYTAQHDAQREEAIRKIVGAEAQVGMDPVRFEELVQWGADKKNPYLLPSHVRQLIEKKNFKPEAFQFDHFIKADAQDLPVYRLVPLNQPNTYEEMANDEEPPPQSQRKLGLTIVGTPPGKNLFEEMSEEDQ